MEKFAAHDLLPEQVWDTTDIPERDLFLGMHTGSAVPLVWAHAEYVKLCASVNEGRIFDMPDHTMERYIKADIKSKLDIWRINLPCYQVTKGNSLRIETLEAVIVTWSGDNWQTNHSTTSKDSGLGIFYTDLPAGLLTGNEVIFTIYWNSQQRWEGQNFTLAVV